MDVLKADQRRREDLWGLFRGVAWDMANLSKAKRIPPRDRFVSLKGEQPQQSPEKQKDVARMITIALGGRVAA